MLKSTWTYWGIITIAILGFYAYVFLLSEDKEPLLIGDATHGHFQIELSCDACHTDAFGGTEVVDQACLQCHKDELEESLDSHPKKKFNDPRNADLLEIIDARSCVACHTEHKTDQTHPMGVTLPGDYCYHCHQEIGEDRESHKDLAYDSCASAGCHNYHDNRALYENFLLKHGHGDFLKDHPVIAPAEAGNLLAMAKTEKLMPELKAAMETLGAKNKHWDNNIHMEKGIPCSTCHASNNEGDSDWVVKPEVEVCSTCHVDETETFLQGKHGMRLAAGLEAISPGESKMDFHHSALETQHSCTACHNAHEFDTQHASTQACLTCHADYHSLAFLESPHGKLASKAEAGEISQDEVVTCATCHMPRVEKMVKGEKLTRTEHNQNANLRPNEKMIRPVCMQCHGLGFSIDALADPELIQNNFNGQPSEHIPSIDWALKRLETE